MNFKYTIFIALFAGGIGGLIASAIANWWMNKAQCAGVIKTPASQTVECEDAPPSPAGLLQGLILVLVSCVFSVVTIDEFGLGIDWLLLVLFVAGIMLPVAAIDARTHLLPDVLTLPGAGLAMLLAVLVLGMDIEDVLLGALVGCGGLFILNKLFELVARSIGVGMGDMKLMLMLGALSGYYGLLELLFISFSLAALWYIVVAVRKRGATPAFIPLGPFLCAGALIQLSFGDVVYQFIS